MSLAKAGYWRYKVVLFIEARSTEEFTEKLEKMKAIAAEKEMEDVNPDDPFFKMCGKGKETEDEEKS